MAEKKLLVVLRKTKGKNPKGEEFVPGLPVFRRDVPQALPEKTAKELIEGAGDRFRIQKPRKKPQKPKEKAEEEE